MLYAKGAGNCVYIHYVYSYVDTESDVVLVYFMINPDNLWVKFDTKGHFHFIYLSMKVIMKYSYLIAM